jgi:hypothetical protein
MTMLIELTTKDGEKVLVNLAQVAQIIPLGKAKPSSGSRIDFANGTTYVLVKETIQEIAKIADEGSEAVVRLA